MKLYGRRLSPYVERVYLQILFKGLEDKIILTDIPGGDLKSPEYLAISPLGKMPLLEDGDFHLPESGVITEYIEEKFPEKPTLPEDMVARARTRLLVRFLDFYVLAPLFQMLPQVMADERDEELIAEKLAEIEKGLDLVEDMTGDGGHLIGEDWTIADFAAIPMFFIATRYLPGFGADPLAGRERLAAWFEAVGKTDFFKASEAAQEEALKAFLARMQAQKDAQ